MLLVWRADVDNVAEDEQSLSMGSGGEEDKVLPSTVLRRVFLSVAGDTKSAANAGSARNTLLRQTVAE